ncbi:MAG: HD domain-containing protein, partial [Caulobacterales bacterium]|nr:HD domain-containing protein [Caulobacterales bacterium]
MAEATAASNAAETTRLHCSRSRRAAAALAQARAKNVPTARELGRKLLDYDASADLDLLERAYETAAVAHYGQQRLSGLPYFSHPVAVAEILIDLRLDLASVITALLHDTVEDTELRLDDVHDRFGEEVGDLVDGVTKLSQVSRARGSSSQAENLQKFVLAIANDVRVLIVKLADRLHNMRT